MLVEWGHKLTIDIIDALFMFSLVWSVGAVTDKEGREKFDLFVRDFLEGNCLRDKYPGTYTQTLLRGWEPPEFPDDAKWGKMKMGTTAPVHHYITSDEKKKITAEPFFGFNEK